jgi:hypothetical protein
MKKFYFVSFIPGGCGNLIALLIYKSIYVNTLIELNSDVADAHIFANLKQLDTYPIIFAGNLDKFLLFNGPNLKLINIIYDVDKDFKQLALQYIIKNVINEYKLLKQGKPTFHKIIQNESWVNDSVKILERFNMFRQDTNSPLLEINDIDSEIISRALGMTIGSLKKQYEIYNKKKSLTYKGISCNINFRDIYTNHHKVVEQIQELTNSNCSKEDLLNILYSYKQKTYNLENIFPYDYINGKDRFCFLHHKYEQI